MKPPTRTTALALWILLSLAAAATGSSEGGWVRFRGPNGCGVAGGALPDELSASPEWSLEVPSGYSSPVAAGDRVFLTGAADGELSTLCVDARSGELLWQRRLPFDGKRPGANSSAACTPATDGERVFVLFHHVGLVVYDLLGEELWRDDLGAPFNLPHGLATSPVVHGGNVVIQLDQDRGSELLCLDAVTGERRWRAERGGAAHSYATPAVHAPAGEPAVVVVSGSYEIAAYALETGERVWWVKGSAWQSKSVPLFVDDLCIVSAYRPSSAEFGLPASPSTFEAALEAFDEDGDGVIARGEWEHEMMQSTWFIWDRDGDDTLDAADFAYLMSAKTEKGALFAIQMGGEGDVTESHVRWKYNGRRGISDVVTPVVLDGTVHLLKDGGIVTAIEASSGEVLEDGRVGEPDQYYASPVAAGGRMLVAGMSGQLSVIEPAVSSEDGGGVSWDVLSTAQLELGKVWATPALLEGRILVRGEQRLVCLPRPR